MADDILTPFETDDLIRGDGPACDWPTLSDWTAVKYGDAVCIEGRVKGHPRLRDGGEIRTSSLRRITRDRRYAETQNTIYLLGVPKEKRPPQALQLICCADWTEALKMLTEWTRPWCASLPARCCEAIDALGALSWEERRAIIDDIYVELSHAGLHRLGELWNILRADPSDWQSCRFAANSVGAIFREWSENRTDDVTGHNIRHIVNGWWAMAKESAGRIGAAEQDPIRLAHTLGALGDGRMEDGPLDRLRRLGPVRIGDPVEAIKEAVAEARKPGIVVIAKIGGNAKDWRGKPTLEEFRPLEGRKLPLVSTPDLTQVRATLAAEFPHAAGAIDVLLSDLIGRQHVTFRPTLLCSEQPGTGKSRLAGRLEILGIHVARYDGAGSNDASFAGCARYWSTAEPSFPLAAVRDSGTANPLCTIDEIDKASKSPANGGLAQALLPFMERETASKYADVYIQGPGVDLSHVSYILTCNDDRLLPKPLRDRLRILRIPTPGPEHLPALARTIVRDIAAGRGIDPAWAPSLDGDETEIAARLWREGGSIRKLRAIIERILARRDEQAPRH